MRAAPHSASRAATGVSRLQVPSVLILFGRCVHSVYWPRRASWVHGMAFGKKSSLSAKLRPGLNPPRLLVLDLSMCEWLPCEP